MKRCDACGGTGIVYPEGNPDYCPACDPEPLAMNERERYESVKAKLTAAVREGCVHLGSDVVEDVVASAMSEKEK